MSALAERRDLTTGEVWKKLLIFFLPIAAGTCIQQLYNAVDGMVVGRFVGTAALAAVGGSAAQVINLLIGFFVALTTGSSVLIAQIFGAGRYEDIKKASGTAVTMCLVMGLALTVFGLLASPAILRLLRTPADTLADAVRYLRIYFLGVPFILVLNMESNMLRSVGDSVSPFLFMVAGCVCNILLDFVFVVLFRWGITGVAVATVVSQVLNMALLSAKLFRPGGEYGLTLSDLGLRRQYIGGMLQIGVPAGLQASMFSVSNMVIQVGVNSLGTLVVASWAMTSKVDGLYWAVSNALGAAITSFVGQNIGAGNYGRVKQCIRQGMLLSVGITVFLSSLLMLLGKPLLHILTTDADVISTTYTMMGYFVPYYFTWTLIEVLSAVLRGAGDAVRPVIIIGLGICLFRIVWIVTVFAAFHTVLVLSLSYVTSWVITGVALFLYYRRGTWLERAKNRITQN